MADGEAGALWYDLSTKNDKLAAGLREAERDLGVAGKRGEDAFATPMERATGRVREGVRGIVSEFNTLRGRGPEQLTQQLERAAREADEARDAVERLTKAGSFDEAPAQARKYADALNEIQVEADQTLADLRELQGADPRFNTPELQRAADELDRVGREAGQTAGQLNEMKGVRADTHLERVAQEANEAAAGMEKAGDKTDGLMGKLQGVKGILVGLGLAISAQQILSFAGDSLEAFSDLQQTTRTVDEVFGASAVVIENWAQRAATAAGLSKREVNEAASVMGQTLINMGFSASDAADKVVQLQQRAADMALAFGKDPQDAILAITAAMRGERDTIEKFGVSIKQADVNSRVLALGLDTSTDAAKKNSEAIAILDLILDQSASSADRFASSQDDVAVKTAQAQAKIENGMAEFGRMVASIQLGAIKVAEALADDPLEGFAMNFGEQGERIHAMADRFGQTFDDLKARIEARMDETGESFDEAFTFIEDRAREAAVDIPATMDEGMRATHQVVVDRGAQIKADWEATAQSIPDAIANRWAQMKANAYQSLVEYQKGLLEGQNLPQVAFDAAMQLLEDEMTEQEEIALLKGRLVTLNHAAGIASAEGKEAARQAINSAISVVTDRLTALGASGYTYGYNLGASYARGIEASANVGGVVRTAAGKLAQAVAGQIGIRSEPSDPDSPLRGITTWGGNIDRTIAGDMIRHADVLTRAAAIAAEAARPDLSAAAVLGAVPDLAVPANGVPGGVGGPGGLVETTRIQHFHLHFQGQERAVDTPFAAVEEAQRMGIFEGSTY